MQTIAPVGTPPKFYQLILQEDLLGGWSLIRQYGITGLPGSQKRQHFDSLGEAQQAIEQLREQQQSHGFRVTFVQGNPMASPPTLVGR